jgi:hypothetical protein
MMTHSKISAFFEEFPFLKKLVHTAWVCDVRVSRISENLKDSSSTRKYLGSRQYENEFGSQTAEIYARNRLFLLDRDGKKVTRVGLAWYNPLSWLRSEETVAKAFLRLGDKAEKVHYIVNLEPVGTAVLANITVFKSPKDKSARALFEEFRRRDAERVEQTKREEEEVHRRDIEEVRSALANIDKV